MHTHHTFNRKALSEAKTHALAHAKQGTVKGGADAFCHQARARLVGAPDTGRTCRSIWDPPLAPDAAAAITAVLDEIFAALR